jgi:hypothetical protein
MKIKMVIASCATLLGMMATDGVNAMMQEQDNATKDLSSSSSVSSFKKPTLEEINAICESLLGRPADKPTYINMMGVTAVSVPAVLTAVLGIIAYDNGGALKDLSPGGYLYYLISKGAFFKERIVCRLPDSARDDFLENYRVSSKLIMSMGTGYEIFCDSDNGCPDGSWDMYGDVVLPGQVNEHSSSSSSPNSDINE